MGWEDGVQYDPRGAMNRYTRHFLAGMIVAVTLLTAGGTRLGACSCGGRGAAACQSVWNSEAVFVATVASLGPEIDSERQIGTLRIGWRERVVMLKVTEAFRGVEVGDLTVRTAASSASCGFSFESARDYVVFADTDPFSRALTVSLCSSTALVEESVEELAYLRGPFGKPSDRGEIRGTVAHYDQYDSVDHPAPSTPFQGAELRLEGYAQAYTTTSGVDGSYKFRVPAGDYRLFVRVREGLYAWPDAGGYAITLKDNRACAVAHVIVRPDSRIAGRLLDDAGLPVPFMSVDLALATEVMAEQFSSERQTLTDARGRFEFAKLDPGRYVPGLTLKRDTPRENFAVWFRPAVSGQPVAVTVAAEARIDLGDIRLPSVVATISLQGVVVDAAGKPVQGADVRFRAANPDTYVPAAPVRTDQDGLFSLSVIAGRTYRIAAEWRSTIPGASRYLSAQSAPFDAVGDLKPFRLVVDEVR
jgi:hypothetical protein